MYDYEEEQIETLEKKNQELRDLCEKLLEEIRRHQTHINDNGADFCHYCGGQFRFPIYTFDCKPDCITNTKIPD